MNADKSAPGVRILVLTAALIVAGTTLLASVASAQQDASPKRVLVLFWGDKDFPSSVQFDQNFQATLQSAPEGTIEYYSEYMDADHFPGENHSLIMRDYLRHKYADRTIDVVVASGDIPLSFLLKYRSDLFTDAPIVFLAVRPPATEDLTAGPGITGFIHRSDYSETLDVALKLHPDTERVFVVSGSLEHDKIFETACREELREYETRVSIDYLTDFTPDKLIVKLKSLPKRSIVLYVWQQIRLAYGLIKESREVLDLVTKSSSAPIYGVASWQVGQGIVGGQVRALETTGARTAEMALRIINGERAQDIPVQNVPTFPMFDWRELKRWGIDENELPPGSILLFKEQSFWEQNRWRVIGVVGLIALQAVLIAVLLVERRRRQRASESLDRLNPELERRVARRTAALDAKSRELETFSYSVAHDLKAPLRGIDGYSRLLLEDYADKLDNQGRLFVQNIKASSEEMNQLIEDLLSYSQIERLQMKPDQIELNTLVETLIEQKKQELAGRDVQFVLNLNGCTVLADSRALAQAIRNYLDNAIKFTRDAATARIEIGARESERDCLVWVQDNGVGFNMKYHEQIFEIFQRLDQDYTGTGVGLAIVRRAMERLGGRAWAESEPGRGATFYLEIPK